MKTVTDRYHAAIRQTGKEMIVTPTNAMSPAEPATTPSVGPAETKHARRQHCYEEALQLHAVGASISQISRLVGADRKTLRGWLQGGGIPRWQQPRRDSLLDPYRAELERRWVAGCRNAARLWRELATAGFAGRPGLVRRWAQERRKTDPAAERPATESQQSVWQPPAGRRVGQWLMADSDALDETDRAFTNRLLSKEPALATMIAADRQLGPVSP